MDLRLIVGLVAYGLAASDLATADTWTITASGVIGSIGGQNYDNAGLFGPSGASLTGDSYIETISTDPLLNTGLGTCGNISCRGTIGGVVVGGVAAPFTITITVNGLSFNQTELLPFINYSNLINALSSNDTSTTLQDSVYQGVQSAGCVAIASTCTASYIAAASTTTPFVPTLSFDQSISNPSGLDAISNINFNYRPTDRWLRYKYYQYLRQH